MEENSKFYTKWWFWLIIIALICALVCVIVVSRKNVEEKATIKLNEDTLINTLEDVTISGTKDLFKITKDVKWNAPEGEPTELFYTQIPYQFSIDGKEYNGIYELGDNSFISEDDGNTKYSLEIKDLTSDGKVKVLITEK